MWNLRRVYKTPSVLIIHLPLLGILTSMGYTVYLLGYHGLSARYRLPDFRACQLSLGPLPHLEHR